MLFIYIIYLFIYLFLIILFILFNSVLYFPRKRTLIDIKLISVIIITLIEFVILLCDYKFRYRRKINKAFKRDLTNYKNRIWALAFIYLNKMVDKLTKMRQSIIKIDINTYLLFPFPSFPFCLFLLGCRSLLHEQKLGPHSE